MEYFVEQGPTHREALDKVRVKYGDNARILSHKTVRIGGFLGFFAREGVEVTGYYSYEPVKRKTVDVEEEKRKILNAVKSDKTIDLVLKEIQDIRERMEKQAESPPTISVDAAHPTIRQIEALLSQNEFTPAYSQEMIGRLRREFSVDELDDLERVQKRVVEWIGESINLRTDVASPADADGKRRSRAEVFILVGPTGVGKTTTIAKLAAMYGITGNGTRPATVRIVTIDNYRIGAKQQIEIYGEIMGIPVSFAESPQDFKKHLDLHSDADLVFVDTIGKSPKDFAKLGEMRELLRESGAGSSVHLALSATTKTSDIYEILRQFEPFNYQSIVLTKLDETTRIGNVVSVLAEKQKSISFITDGQGVPQDISRASVVKLLTNLEGFRINRDHVDARFG
ncbi:MAG TPA: flagellar biosynthesis protein FlhF [Spirochaetia bacterium]|nr:flagellar biosynthesis protein FlhF [Spirochaetia bacterium]